MKHSILFMAVLMVASFSSCKKKKKEEEETSPSPKDKIEILNVDHTDMFDDGDLVNFDVSGTYELNSRDSARISIGFNNSSSSGTYMMIDEVVIYQGSGTFNFDVDATVKDWGSQADFKVYVNIGKITDGAYSPSASDYYTIIPQD